MTAKSNSIMPESDDRVLCIEMTVPVTLENYNGYFRTEMRKIAEKHKQVRALFYYPNSDTAVPWEEAAADLDFQLTVEHGGVVRKIAIVNGPEKVVQRWKIKTPFIGGDVRFFTKESLKEAVDWVKSDA